MYDGLLLYYAKSLKWLVLNGVLEHAYWALLVTLLFALMFLPRLFSYYSRELILND